MPVPSSSPRAAGWRWKMRWTSPWERRAPLARPPTPRFSCTMVRSSAMSLEAHKNLVRRYQEILNNGDLDALGTVVATDISMPTSFPGFPPGLEGARAIAAANIQMIPDFHVSIDELIPEGDRLAAL